MENPAPLKTARDFRNNQSAMLNIRQQRVIETHHRKVRTKFVHATGKIEGYDFKFIPEFVPPPTACWGFNNGKHSISINEKCDETADKGKKKVVDYVKQVYRHEWEHSQQTERDFKKVNAALQAHKIPFTLFNLFEDARIEFNARRRDKRGFGWKKWNTPKARPESPISFLFAIIVAEPVKALRIYRRLDPDSKTAFYYNWKGLGGRIANYYYPRIVRCSTTLDLVPVLKEWLVEFPDKNGNTSKGGGRTNGVHGEDYEPSSAEAGEPVPAESEPSEGDPSQQGGASSAPSSEPIKCTPAKPSYVPPPPLEDEIVFGRRIAAKLRNAFTNKIGRGFVKSSKPSRRIRLRDICANRFDHPYKQRRQEQIGVPNINLLVDCSGSMGCGKGLDSKGRFIVPRYCARVLIVALNELARQGVLSGTVFLCEGNVRRRFQLGHATEEDIQANSRISGQSEGIGNAIKSNIKELAGSKYVVCFTDGDFMDTRLEPSEIAAHGIYTIGLFVGDEDKTETLKSQGFNLQISRKTIEELADTLTRRLSAAA